jgi:probable rRNA maturation factor
VLVAGQMKLRSQIFLAALKVHNQMVEFINQSQIKLNPKALTIKLNWMIKQLKKQKVKKQKLLGKNLTVVFVTKAQIKALNSHWRGKNRETDILSFQGMTKDDLGELVICPQVLKKQAKEHKLQFEDELFYMLIHGVLHLLGYDHERRQIQAKQMFEIQDKVFQTYLIDNKR